MLREYYLSCTTLLLTHYMFKADTQFVLGIDPT